MSNGKGDKPRKGANLEKFRNNYDDINWSKEPPKEEDQKCPNSCNKPKCNKESEE